MTVQELIDKLQQVEDKSILVAFTAEDRGTYHIADFSPNEVYIKLNCLPTLILSHV